jgi:hypothetical protein
MTQGFQKRQLFCYSPFANIAEVMEKSATVQKAALFGVHLIS